MTHLLDDSAEDIAEQEKIVYDIRSKIGEIDYELSLYYSEEWGVFAHRLRTIEKESIESLINNPEGVEANRAKIKLVRHLLSIKDTLSQERSRLEELLQEPLDE